MGGRTRRELERTQGWSMTFCSERRSAGLCRSSIEIRSRAPSETTLGNLKSTWKQYKRINSNRNKIINSVKHENSDYLILYVKNSTLNLKKKVWFSSTNLYNSFVGFYLVCSFKWWITDQTLVTEDPYAPQVYLLTVCVALNHLWGEVVHCPTHCTTSV